MFRPETGTWKTVFAARDLAHSVPQLVGKEGKYFSISCKYNMLTSSWESCCVSGHCFCFGTNCAETEKVPAYSLSRKTDSAFQYSFSLAKRKGPDAQNLPCKQGRFWGEAHRRQTETRSRVQSMFSRRFCVRCIPARQAACGRRQW